MVKYKEEAENWNNFENHTWSLGEELKSRRRNYRKYGSINIRLFSLFTGDTYILTNLKPLKKYAFKFAAINEVGFGDFAGELTQQMPEISVPSEPIVSNPIVRDAKYIESPYATKIELRWIVPAANGAAIEKYTVSVCAVSGGTHVIRAVYSSDAVLFCSGFSPVGRLWKSRADRKVSSYRIWTSA